MTTDVPLERREGPGTRERLVLQGLPWLLIAMICCGLGAKVAAPRADSLLTRDASVYVLLADVDRGLAGTVYVDGDHLVWRPNGAHTWSATRLQAVGRSGAPLDSVSKVLFEAREVNRDARVEVVSPSRVWRALEVVGGLGAVATLLLLIGGPAPRRATRWAWFWLMGVGRPFGLGVLAFLLWGAPRVPRSRQVGDRAEPVQRLDGAAGFGISLLVSLVVTVLGAVVIDQAVPDRDGSASYTYDTAR